MDAKEDYIKTPISVLRYITELEKSEKPDDFMVWLSVGALCGCMGTLLLIGIIANL